MNLSDLQHFLAMGGYAAYVWPAYGMVAVVLIGNLIAALVKK
jgi:heme exporter protein D